MACALAFAALDTSALAQDQPTREELLRRLAELDAERADVLQALSESDDAAADQPDSSVDVSIPEPTSLTTGRCRSRKLLAM